MVLEAIYEPVFSDLSHGFRPNRSCHTALREVKYGFCGVRWFIEGDIRGCFDNIDHNVLISLLSKKVKDARFLQLIRKFLKAGYLENWVYHSTYSGTPQGGILSPILANIYLHELDMFVEKLKKDFYKSPEAQYTREYNRIRARVGKLSKKIASAEVLVRWKRANGDLWFPDSFLPILEETGEIEALDYYVYETAFQWLTDRREKGLKLLSLSLNVSPVHFRKIHTFTEKVSHLIQKYEIPSQYLVFEITESTYIHNIEAVNHMIRFFHEKNIRISMDDFGSGYSSLNTLKDILFDEVKIDKKFLSDRLTENGKIVLQEIFHLLKRTNKFIVCEGVETKEMVDFLVVEGCDELQGYYYYKPMEMAKFEQLIG